MKKYSFLGIPVAAVVLCSFLAFTTADQKVADLFQRPLKSTEESPSVVMINVDDTAIGEIGTFPLSRDVYGTTLNILKELGADGTIFDLSFIDKSALKLNESYLKKNLPENIQNEFTEYKAGNQTLNEAEMNVIGALDNVSIDADQTLADGLLFAGNITLPVTMTYYDTGLTEEDNRLLEEKFALNNVEAKNDTITPEYPSLLSNIRPLMENARNIGFVNADVDADGYLRRLNLVTKYNGKYYGQLVFKTILEHYGNPAVEISNRFITLKDAVIERDENGEPSKVETIRIPRAKDGKVIIKYPKTVYNHYRQLSLWQVYRISLLENNLRDMMEEMNEHGFFAIVKDNPLELFNTAKDVEASLVYGEDADFGITYEELAAEKAAMVKALDKALSAENKQWLLSQVRGKPQEAELSAYIEDSFMFNNNTLKEYKDSCGHIAKIVKGADCIFGTTATSTTDWGINQYEEHYPNPGVHYVLANMLLSRDFVDDSPAWISILIALLICAGYSLAAKKIKGTGRQILLGILFTVASVLVLLGIFLLTRKYFGAAVPGVSIFLTFVATTIVGFITASKDKKFITNAFSQCLSKEVVNEIVANPSSFKLGGQRLEMTAIFTDIQKFSGFSELLTASQLVALLNYYLTKMSDIIMEERGTVDKYEGDAIIALVGAPVKMEDHAERAVSAALKMKAAELKMNQEIKEIASLEEKPAEIEQDLFDAFKIMVQSGRNLFTRIGLNSGEMIAGYMGSENKKNYTMMGNNVNLASRLEGVNKQYSTGGILMSEATRKLCGDRFIVRRLDRVRVVNVNTPIRLYEPLCEKAGADEKTVKYAEAWEKTMDIFEAGQYDKALECFKKLSFARPSDKTALYYIGLLEKFFCNGTTPKEADGAGVEYMDDGVFKLLQK